MAIDDRGFSVQSQFTCTARAHPPRGVTQADIKDDCISLHLDIFHQRSLHFFDDIHRPLSWKERHAPLLPHEGRERVWHGRRSLCRYKIAPENEVDPDNEDVFPFVDVLRALDKIVSACTAGQPFRFGYSNIGPKRKWRVDVGYQEDYDLEDGVYELTNETITT